MRFELREYHNGKRVSCTAFPRTLWGKQDTCNGRCARSGSSGRLLYDRVLLHPDHSRNPRLGGELVVQCSICMDCGALLHSASFAATTEGVICYTGMFCSPRAASMGDDTSVCSTVCWSSDIGVQLWLLLGLRHPMREDPVQSIRLSAQQSPGDRSRSGPLCWATRHQCHLAGGTANRVSGHVWRLQRNL